MSRETRTPTQILADVAAKDKCYRDVTYQLHWLRKVHSELTHSTFDSRGRRMINQQRRSFHLKKLERSLKRYFKDRTLPLPGSCCVQLLFDDKQYPCFEFQYRPDPLPERWPINYIDNEKGDVGIFSAAIYEVVWKASKKPNTPPVQIKGNVNSVWNDANTQADSVSQRIDVKVEEIEEFGEIEYIDLDSDNEEYLTVNSQFLADDSNNNREENDDYENSSFLPSTFTPLSPVNEFECRIFVKQEEIEEEEAVRSNSSNNHIEISAANRDTNKSNSNNNNANRSLYKETMANKVSEATEDEQLMNDSDYSFYSDHSPSVRAAPQTTEKATIKAANRATKRLSTEPILTTTITLSEENDNRDKSSNGHFTSDNGDNNGTRNRNSKKPKVLRNSETLLNRIAKGDNSNIGKRSVSSNSVSTLQTKPPPSSSSNLLIPAIIQMEPTEHSSIYRVVNPSPQDDSKRKGLSDISSSSAAVGGGERHQAETSSSTQSPAPTIAVHDNVKIYLASPTYKDAADNAKLKCPFMFQNCKMICKKANMMEHLNIKHLGMKPHLCIYPRCYKTFDWFSLAIKHVKRIHRPTSDPHKFISQYKIGVFSAFLTETTLNSINLAKTDNNSNSFSICSSFSPLLIEPAPPVNAVSNNPTLLVRKATASSDINIIQKRPPEINLTKHI